MRLIDADKLKEEIESLIRDPINTDILLKTSESIGLASALVKIDNQPTVDTEPVVHAKWIDRNGQVVYPSGERYMCTHCCSHNDKTKYCPHCGAKMDKEGR